MKTETTAQIDSCLNVQVSCFANYDTPGNPKPVNLLTWLTSDKYRAQVERIRAEQSKAQRSVMKAVLPAITPSGLFSYREESALIKHSGLIQIDVDLEGNEHLANYGNLKEQLARLQNFAYIGLSASGLGYWGLIPIAHPEKHKAHFRALKRDFARLGIRIDNKPQNVASLRGISWDAAGVFNHKAPLYWKTLEEEAKQPDTYRPTAGTPRPAGSDADKVELILQAAEGRRIDLTPNYSDWFAMGCALANTFGEAGRDYFHRASQYYPQYSRQDTDKQFDYCKRKRYSFSLGTFFALADKCGLRWKDSVQGEAAPQPKPMQAPKANVSHSAPKHATDSDLPPGFGVVEFPNGKTVTYNGLPLQWLNEAEHAEAVQRLGARGQLAVMAITHPAVSQLVQTFGLEVGM